MYTVELYAKIRRAVLVDGKSQRQVAEEFGINRKTVKKMLLNPLPPGYVREKAIRLPKLAPFVDTIRAILEADKDVIQKQRHTAKRLFERLTDEYGFNGSYSAICSFLAKEQRRQKEVFIPLVHDAGYAQVDFGEADIYLAGKKTRIHYFCLHLPHSDAIFVKAYLAETTEAFQDGHVAAFTWLGGVPKQIVYDNSRIAVSKIQRHGVRVRTKAFLELQSVYLFEDRFGRPGRGNDKGDVEGLVGFARRNFMVPLPVVSTLDELNKRLLDACSKRQKAVLRGYTESIGERLQRDLDALIALPAIHFDPCEQLSTRVSSLSLVRYRNNDYSVPTCYGYQDVQVRGYVDKVVIAQANTVIAEHPRCYDEAQFIYNPFHYLALLERKPGALSQAAPLQNWKLPPVFPEIQRQLEERQGHKGRSDYIQVLRLLESYRETEVEAAIKEALRLGAISADAIKHLALAKRERQPAKLNLSDYPSVPRAAVNATQPGAYMALLKRPSSQEASA
jgi:transposase